MYDAGEQIEAYQVPVEPRLGSVSRNRNRVGSIVCSGVAKPWKGQHNSSPARHWRVGEEKIMGLIDRAHALSYVMSPFQGF